MAADKQQSIVAKLAGVLVALVAAWAAQKLIDTSWKKVTGHAPPQLEDDDDDNRFAEILVATAVSGAVIATARALATRGAAKYIS